MHGVRCTDTNTIVLSPTQVKYLQDYANKLELNIQYETEIVDVSRFVDGGKNFHLTDQSNTIHRCKVVIVGYVGTRLDL